MAARVLKPGELDEKTDKSSIKDSSTNADEKTASQTTEQNPVVDAVTQKHPLHNKWCLWFYKSEKGKDFRDNLNLIADFDTVEDFWALYNHIQKPSQLRPGSDYCVFKDGVVPMWEDPANCKGGRLQLVLDARGQKDKRIDNIWLETLFLLIGEMLEELADFVAGAVVQIRARADRLSLWTTSPEDLHNRDIDIRFRQIINLPGEIATKFQYHDDQKKYTIEDDRNEKDKRKGANPPK